MMKTVKTRTGAEGYDLSCVLREILERLMRERGLNPTTLAAELGVPQTTLGRVLRGQDFKVEHLSLICAGLEVNPVALFASHPLYDHEARAFMRFGKDALYDCFRTLLSVADAKQLVDSIEEQKQLGIFEHVRKAVADMVGAAKAATRKAIRSRSGAGAE